MPKISSATYTERRRHILNAATVRFAEYGIHISIDEVCEAAGVSKGAFYGYFRSKDALFEAIASEHGALLDALRPLATRAALAEMLAERASVDRPHFARVELDTLAYALRHPPLHAILRANAEKLRLALRTVPGLDERLPAARATRLLEFLVAGMFVHIALDGADAVEEVRRGIDDALDLLDGTS